MFPKLTNGRVDKQVTNILLAYTNMEYIADAILPAVPNLTEESGYIGEMGNSHLRVYSSKRSLYDESEHRMEFTIDNDKRYHIEYYDREIYIPDRLQSQLQLPFNARRDASISLREAMMLEREVGLATMLTSTAVITNNTTLAGTNKWTDTVNSDPISNIQTACDSVFNASLKEPTDIMLSRSVINALKAHPQVLNYYHNTAQIIDTAKVIAFLISYFDGIKRVHIGRARKISSKPGQTETKANIWGNDCVVFYRPDTPSLFTPSFGYKFSLSGQEQRATTRRHTNDMGDMQRIEWAYQDKILNTDCAYLIKDCI